MGHALLKKGGRIESAQGVVVGTKVGLFTDLKVAPITMHVTPGSKGQPRIKLTGAKFTPSQQCYDDIVKLHKKAQEKVRYHTEDCIPKGRISRNVRTAYRECESRLDDTLRSMKEVDYIKTRERIVNPSSTVDTTTLAKYANVDHHITKVASDCWVASLIGPIFLRCRNNKTPRQRRIDRRKAVE